MPSTDHAAQELDAWRRLAIARNKILVGYRTGKTPASGIDQAMAAEAKLRKLGIDPHTGAALA
jgi:hypothetical protein